MYEILEQHDLNRGTAQDNVSAILGSMASRTSVFTQMCSFQFTTSYFSTRHHGHVARLGIIV